MYRSLFNKVAWSCTATILKKRLQQRCFTENFVKFLRTPFYRESTNSCFWSSKNAFLKILANPNLVKTDVWSIQPQPIYFVKIFWTYFLKIFWTYFKFFILKVVNYSRKKASIIDVWHDLNTLNTSVALI